MCIYKACGMHYAFFAKKIYSKQFKQQLHYAKDQQYDTCRMQLNVQRLEFVQRSIDAKKVNLRDKLKFEICCHVLGADDCLFYSQYHLQT